MIKSRRSRAALVLLLSLPLLYPFILHAEASEDAPPTDNDQPYPENQTSEYAVTNVDQRAVPAVINEARAVLEKPPEELNVDDVQDLLERIEESLPSLMMAVQDQRRHAAEIKREGKNHPNLHELMERLASINEEIEAAIDDLPELVEAEEIATLKHGFVMEATRLRVQLSQKLLQVVQSGEELSAGAAQQTDTLATESE